MKIAFWDMPVPARQGKWGLLGESFCVLPSAKAFSIQMLFMTWKLQKDFHESGVFPGHHAKAFFPSVCFPKHHVFIFLFQKLLKDIHSRGGLRASANTPTEMFATPNLLLHSIHRLS